MMRLNPRKSKQNKQQQQPPAGAKVRRKNENSGFHVIAINSRLATRLGQSS